MKLSGVLMVLAFVCLVILKTQPAWLFGEKPAPTIRYQVVQPKPLPRPLVVQPQLRPLRR